MSNDAGRVAATDTVAATHTRHNQGVTRFNYIVIAQLIPGPNVAALEWSKEVTAYINDTYKLAQPLKLYQPLFGELNKVTWSMEFENLAAYEALHEQA
ncbi:MAG: hypothetical protein O2782_14985 [bacterium]|nr:hypothetical protein [bacterium]